MSAKRLAAAVCAAAITTACSVSATAENAEGQILNNITVSGNNANTTQTMLYRGVGMVSANNSSRLLLDYKAENPEKYWEIMNYIFGKKGLNTVHLKLEMGSDINSSSGTEPSVMRYADEKADVTRGAGYQLAADAKTINPDLTLDMLWWSEPKWVSDADDVYAARYKWYKCTLDAAYSTYGLKFDYVSATQNERAYDNEWIKYLSKALKAETDCPYDYSAIKIVAGDEVTTWNEAGELLKAIREGDDLANAIDVVGSHYTSSSTAQAQELTRSYGRELWFSEGSSPMAYSEGAWRFDEGSSGLSGINGVLDIANRYIAMYPQGGMTLCQFQPVVSAYYDGVNYCHKQFINACDPWSGYYTLDSGFFMMLHFTQFMDKGWSYIDGACYSDGVPGGDGHAIVDAVHSYMTVCSPEKDEYTTVITNTTAEPMTYNFTVSDMECAGKVLNLWETRGPDGGAYNEHYFKNIGSVTPTENGGKYEYSVTVKPYSIITLSTIELQPYEYKNADSSERTILELPYTDDFEYADYPADYLASRGNAPRYMTDEGGAFEVNGGVLRQQITTAEKAKEWGGTPNPTTNFGDDRWYNYSVSADVMFEPSEDKTSNYAGVGLRYILGCQGESGWWLKLTESGEWSLLDNGTVLLSGTTDADTSAAVRLKIEAIDNTVRGYINGGQVFDYTAESTFPSAGRAALYSSYDRNSFDELEVAPAENADPYISRVDNTDLAFNYSGEWVHDTMSGFRNYKRTLSTGTAGCSLTVDFNGTGIALLGGGKGSTLKWSVDGGEEQEYTFGKSTLRKAHFMVNGLESGEHRLTVTVVDGNYNVDSAQVMGGTVYTAKQLVHTASEPEEQQPTADISTADSGAAAEPSAPESDTDPNNASAAESGKGGFPVAAGVGIGAALAAAAVAAGVVIHKKKKK